MKKDQSKTNTDYTYVTKGVYKRGSTYRSRYTKDGVTTSKYFSNKADAIKFYKKNTNFHTL